MVKKQGAHGRGLTPAVCETAKVVQKCVDVLCRLLRLYGFDDIGYRTRPTVTYYVELCDQWYGGNWMKMFKDKIAAFFSHHMSRICDEEFATIKSPAPPGVFNAGILLGGRAYKYITYMSRTDPDLFRTFVISVLYSKKGFPRPTKGMLRAAEREAFKKLTSPVIHPHNRSLSDSWGNTQGPVPLMSWSDADKERNTFLPLYLTKEVVVDTIRRTVREVYRGKRYTDSDRLEPFFPSTSANYNNSRTLLGTVGTILDHPTLMEGLHTKMPLVTSGIRGQGRSAHVVLNDVPLRVSFLELFARVREAAIDEKPIAVPLALPEALKTRVISKGPPLTYCTLKPLQRFLWRVLSQHRAFELVGKTVSPTLIQSVLGAKLYEDEAYLSIDYTDATNEMYSWASEAAVDELSEVLDLEGDERELFARAMTHHLMENPEDGSISQQTRGQLMGSIVSFPILCLVNAALVRLSFELANRRSYLLSNLPAMFNGDDGLLRCNKHVKGMWERVSAFAGLAPSVGKVYYSRKYLNINSTSFFYYPTEAGLVRYKDGEIEDLASCAYIGLVDGTRRFEYFRQDSYVNLGLFFGMTRSGEAVAVDSLSENWSAKATALLESCPDRIRSGVYAGFLKENHEKLSDTRIPWFVPANLGGLGLPEWCGRRASQIDRRVCRLIQENPETFRLPSNPTPKRWLTWDYAEKRLKQFPIGQISALGLENAAGSQLSVDSLMGKLCVEALFREEKVRIAPTLVIASMGKQATVGSAVKQYPFLKKFFGQYSDKTRALTASSKIASRRYMRYVNNLRSVWKRALHTKLPLPHPYRAFPARSLSSIHSLAGVLDVFRSNYLLETSPTLA